MEIGDLVQFNTAMRKQRLSYYIFDHDSPNDLGIIVEIKEFIVEVYWIKNKKITPVSRPLLMKVT
jgi:hypothetical protein